MAFGCTQQRQSCRRPNAGKRFLTKHLVSRKENYSAPLSVGRLCLMAIAITTIGTHNVLANANSVNRHLHHPFYLSNLRGGSSNDGNLPVGGDDQPLNDEDLDEYIDFLLAYADDKATEADNPLFRDEVNNALLLEDEVNTIAVEESGVGTQEDEDDTTEEEKIIELQESSPSGDNVVEPLVDDVNDDTQLDAMVETLVASIDDNDLEDESSLEDSDDVTSTLIIEDARQTDKTGQENESEVSSEEIFVNDIQEADSAVEEVPVDGTIDGDIEDASLETPILESVDSVWGEDHADEEEVVSDTFYLGSSAVENMPLPVNVDEAVAEDTAEVPTEPTTRVPLFTSLMQKIGLKKEESQIADITIVDSDDQIEELDIDQDKTTTIALDSSDLAEEPVIKISEPDSHSPENASLEESDASDQNAGKESSKADGTEISAPVAAAVAVVDEAVDDQATKTSVAYSVKQYYQGALGSVKDFWSKKRWYGHRETKAAERDYTKIYEKYFAANNQPSAVQDVSIRKESSHLSSAFLRPWGTITKYLKPEKLNVAEDSERSHIDYYSIGIQGFVDKDLNRGSASRVEADCEKPIETNDDVEDSEVYIGSEVAAAFVEDPEEIHDSTGVPTSEEDSKEQIHTEVVPTMAEDLKLEVGMGQDSVDVEELEVEVIDEDVPEEVEGFIESSEFEVDVNEVPEDAEAMTESAKVEVEVDAEDVLEDAIILNDGADETVAVETEIIAESNDMEVASEEVPEGTEVITEDIQVEVVSENIPEEIEAEVAREEDTEVIIEISGLEVNGKEVHEDAELLTEGSEAEIGIKEVFEVGAEDDIEEDAEDAEFSIEGLKAEIDGEDTPAGTEFEVGAEDNIEQVPKEAEVITEVFEAEIDGEDTAGNTEVEVDSIEVFSNTDETIVETDQLADSIENTPVEVPRRATIFSRLWGTTKAHNIIDPLEVDDDMTGMTIEETDDETDHPTDGHEMTSGKGFRKPNIFIRLWGTSKERNESYSLGLQGIKEVSSYSDAVETTDNGEEIDQEDYVAEELDVDISVSIGITEKEDPMNSLEISESSGSEEMEDESDFMEPEVPERQEAMEIFSSESALVKDIQANRNVLQLHNLETQDRKEQRSLPENASIEVTDNISSTEDSNEIDERTTLQLHQENSISFSDGNDDIVVNDQTVNEEPDESEMEVEYYPDAGAVEEISEDSFSEDYIQEADEKEDVRGFIVADADQYVDSGEKEQFIEQLDEEEEAEGSFVANIVNDLVSDENEDFVEQKEELDEGVEEEISIETSEEEEILESEEEERLYVDEIDEEEFVEDEEIIESEEEEEQFVEDEEIIESEEEEEQFYVDEIDEEEFLEEEETVESDDEEQFDVDEIDEDEPLLSHQIGSSPYSLEVEMQNSNFLSRFLVNKGLEQLVMIAILITEWFRVYILAPFFESIDWIVEGKGQDLLQTVINTRGGGALAPALSETEDIDQTDVDEEIEKEERVFTEDGCTELTDTDNLESSSLRDGQKGNTEQDDSAEDEKSTSETVPAEKPHSASRQVPPNLIFRRLLDYGRVGHILIMEIILASEWVNMYVPQIQTLAHYIMYDVLKRKKRLGRKPGEPDNVMNSGFINTGEGSRLPKLSKKVRKKEDQKALDQLQTIGNVNQAKYSFISQSFMERHGLGPYNVAVSEIELDLESSKKGSFSSKHDEMEEGEAESDSGWILDALGVEEDAAPSSLPFDTNVGVSIGSGSPKVSVGLEFKLGKKKRGNKSSSQNLRNVIVGNSSISSKHKKSPKPRVSDSESGIMGRLRAQGANSLMGRSILGAYPGDLPAPDEAADSRGLIDMAQKYGYGDWSDEDEADDYTFGDDEDDDDENSLVDYSPDEDEFRPKKRSSKRRKTKKRRSSSSRNQQSAEVGFGLSVDSSAQEPVSVSSVSTRRRRRSSSSTSISSSISGSVSSLGSRRRRKTRSSRLPSLAMETLGGNPTPTKRSEPNSDVNTKSILTDSAAQKTKRKRKTTRTLGPAMSILHETKKATDTMSTKSQNEDE